MIRATRTVQFRVADVGFWKDNILPRCSTLQMLLTADVATLKISNQKNGRMGQMLHHEGTGSNGAVASLARWVHHILSHKGTEDNLLCDVLHQGTWTAIHSAEIVTAVHTAAKSLKLQNKGIDPDAHSLRAGGAMALIIMGYSDSTIRKFGRWASDMWQMYIHSQISKLYEGVPAKMRTPLPYHNIAFIDPAASSSSTAAPTA